MDAKQDILKWVLDYYREDCATETVQAYCDENLEQVEDDSEISGKTVIDTVIYRDKRTGLFYRVTQCRDNSGYWGDGESYDPEIEQVWQVPVASWKYVTKDPEAA